MVDELEKHVEVAARWLIRVAVEAWAEEGWENVGDWGEWDYERVVEKAMGMLGEDVTGEEWEVTYEWFAKRAEGVEA